MCNGNPRKKDDVKMNNFFVRKSNMSSNAHADNKSKEKTQLSKIKNLTDFGLKKWIKNVIPKI